jgi:hypothetical protein
MFETHSHEVNSDNVLNMKMRTQFLFETYAASQKVAGLCPNEVDFLNSL